MDTQSSTDGSDIITVKEAAARLHVAVNTMYNWIASGCLTYHEGLFRVRRRTLFHWPTLKACALDGALDPNRTVHVERAAVGHS